MQKFLTSMALLACCLIGMAGLATAQEAEKGPAELVLESTIDPAKTPKPAYFPHGEHQGRLECKTCHHSKGPDGKQIPYAEGQKIEKCETCHNSKSGMPKKLASFKNAAHSLCKTCHGKNDKALTKCTVCHKKKS